MTTSEELPLKKPESLGMGFTIYAKVDEDHTGDIVTRRSRTDFLIHLNSTLSYWNSKKQNSTETNTFSSEFISLK